MNASPNVCNVHSIVRVVGRVPEINNSPVAMYPMKIRMPASLRAHVKPSHNPPAVKSEKRPIQRKGISVKCKIGIPARETNPTRKKTEAANKSDRGIRILFMT